MKFDSQLVKAYAKRMFPGRHVIRAGPVSGGISAQTYVFQMLILPEEERDPGAGPFIPLNRKHFGDYPSHNEMIILRVPSEAVLLANPRAAEDEFATLQFLQAFDLPTPEAYLLDVSCKNLPAPFYMMGYIRGFPNYTLPGPPDLALQMAHALAQIHAAGDQAARAAAPETPAFPPHLPHFADRDIPRLSANLALDTTRFQDTIGAAWPFPRHNPDTLLHGDFWPGNLLWLDGRLVGVVDWEDAAQGDRLADLAIARLDLLWIYDRAVMEDFTRAYLLEMPCDTRSLPLWDLWAAHRLARLVSDDLDGWAAFFKNHRQDITPALIRERYHQFVEQALKAIEL